MKQTTAQSMPRSVPASAMAAARSPLVPLLAFVLLAPQSTLAEEAELLSGESRGTDSGAQRTGNLRSGGRSAGTLAWDVIGEHAVIEGDMLIGRVDADGKLASTTSVRGFGHNRLLDRWPDGVIPYELDMAMSGDQREKVMAALEHWMEKSRITFAERGSERADAYPTWIQFVPEQGCASYVGRADIQPQPLYVQNCTVGSIIHEIGHAIGLYHEHTRPDRDNFIQVDYANVIDGREHNFEILYANTQAQGEYDFGSIMHYGETFFSSNGQRTIKAPQGVAIGQRVALSEGDVRTVDRMYATDLALGVTHKTTPVTVADGSSRSGLELEVMVRNLGSLGAHDLSIELEIGDEADWLSVSEGSGWSCLTRQAALGCTRETLAENQTSSFVLHLDPGGHDADELTVSLNSRTLDIDGSNNTLNDDDPNSLPTIAAAQPKEEGDSTSPAASPEPAPEPATDGSSTTSDSGGGTFAPLGLFAMALLKCVRRRRGNAVRLRS